MGSMYAAPQTPPLAGTLSRMSAGVPGVRQTLGVMRRFVRQYRTNLDLLNCARNLVYLTPAKNELAECEAIFDWVRDCIRYTKDINDVETVSAPDKTLAIRQGDCDDKSTLLATLFECVGYPTRFTVAAYDAPGAYQHVYVGVFCANQWIACDATESHPMGWEPPNAIDTLTENV